MIRDWGCNPPFYLPLNLSTALLFTFFLLAATLFFISTPLFSSQLWCGVVVLRSDGWKVVNNNEYGCNMEGVDWYFFTVDRWLGTNVNISIPSINGCIAAMICCLKLTINAERVFPFDDLFILLPQILLLSLSILLFLLLHFLLIRE